MPNYTISDFISKLNVARKNRSKTIMTKPYRIVFELLAILESLGAIRGYHVVDDNSIEVVLKYDRTKMAFTDIKVVSTPGRRIYVSILELYKLKDRYPSEIFVLSTSEGLKLDIDCLRERLGGLVLLKISF
jgi:small subunit ribosomal protein S8